jgi:hypothetical protein
VVLLDGGVGKPHKDSIISMIWHQHSSRFAVPQVQRLLYRLTACNQQDARAMWLVPALAAIQAAGM